MPDREMFPEIPQREVKLASRPRRPPLRPGESYGVICFPPGFTPTTPANTDREL